MRDTSLLLIALVLATPVVAAAEIPPRMVAAIPVADAPPEPFVNRAGARELIRVRASVNSRAIAPNLRHEADVETLANSIALNPSHNEAVRLVGDGASTVRAQISGATPGTVLWFGGDHDAPLERFVTRGGVEWSPTVQGSVMYVASESRVDGVTVTKLALGRLKPAPASASCAIDACSKDDDASRAVALIRFVRDDASYVCTGGLVNDAAGSGTPFFLTAQHCISTQEEAESIEVVWDDRSCDTRGYKTYGADLLVATAETDVALLRLHKLPPNRVFLGIELAPLAEGTVTYRLSHGSGAPQQYTAGIVRTTGAECPSAPRSKFIYTVPTAGTVSLGSSGAPLLLPGLRIAGQLLGLCGPDTNAACATYNDMVDGSISASWPMLAPYLDPQVPARRRSAR